MEFGSKIKYQGLSVSLWPNIKGRLLLQVQEKLQSTLSKSKVKRNEYV